ncbi:MAG: hypothetical protein DSZ24_04985, partial [Thermodesulfatator sp.]
MKKVVIMLLLVLGMVWRVDPVWATDPEIKELKQMLRQVMEENRRLAQRVNELERRLEAYERRAEKAQPSLPSEKTWYQKMKLGLSVAGVIQGVTGTDREVLRDEDKGYAASA